MHLLPMFFKRNGRAFLSAAFLIGVLVPAARAEESQRETLPEGLEVVSIEAVPATLELTHRFDYRQLLILGQLKTGETVDLTRAVSLQTPASGVTVSEHRLIRPVSNGEQTLVFEYQGRTASVVVKVRDIAKPRRISFVADVQPLISRLGCNQGTCHGAKDGKAEFKLSLRGYDPLLDHRALTDDIGARRFNRVAPDQSLMLRKASGAIPHVGGVRTTPDEPAYQLLRQWVASGAKLDLESPRVTSIKVFPENPTVPLAGMTQQLAVMATYSDGSQRDVTAEAFIESGDIEILEADQTGLLTTLRRGEAPALVRYEGSYAATTITIMGDRTGFQWRTPPLHNYIDELVYNKLRRVKVLPSEICSDEEFVRRVYLDLTGLPPTVAQVRAFTSHSLPSRENRDRLVDALVGGPEYIEFWTNKWADMLQVNRKFLGEEGAITLRNWIKQSIAENKPYDQFAYEILTAGGSNLENPPAAYYKVLRDPAAAMENSTQLFLAVRFSCNKCHDHPFERWTQDQYYNLAAYFTQIGRKEDKAFAGQRIGGSAVEGAKPLVEIIYDTGSGEIKHDRTGEISPPKFPYQHADTAPASASRRRKLATWITSPKNIYFARSYVNRQWGYLLGRGIIDPIDDIRAGNPPTNPELLDALTADFIGSGFDAQHMLRLICKSRVYQHSVVANRWNEDDQINYSHNIPRRLPAEVLFDAIHVAAGAPFKIAGAPAGFRAAQLPDAGIKVSFLDDFGRPARESSCECERSSGMVLGPIMKLVNGPTVANALVAPGNALAKLEASQPDDKKMLEELFLRFLARRPTEAEIKLSLKALEAPGREHPQHVAALQAYEKTLPAKQAAWETGLKQETVWTVLEPLELRSEAGAVLEKQADHSVLVSGKNGKDIYTIVAQTDLQGVTGIRLESLANKALPAGGPGRAQNGNFVLSELRLNAAAMKDPSEGSAVKLQNGSADFEQDGFTAANAIDGNEGSGWAVSPSFDKTHTAIFETQEAISFAGGAKLSFQLSQQHPDGTHSLGAFRLSVTHSPRPLKMKSIPAAFAAALNTPPAERDEAQRKLLSDAHRAQDKELNRLLAEEKRSAAALKNRRLMGLQDLAWALINNPAFLFNH